MSHARFSGRINDVAKPTSKAYKPQNAQRIVFESLIWLEGGANDSLLHIAEPSPREVLYDRFVDIVEHGVDRSIASQSILLGCPEFHLRVPAIFGVGFFAEID